MTMGAVKITFKQLRCKKDTIFTANFIVLFYCVVGNEKISC